MFEQLRIQNFQAHDKLVVDLDPAVTTIVGPTDAGKSAIMRALRWVCTNQGWSDDFITWGAKGCTVKLKVDGHTITRRRSHGGAVNTYHLDDQEYKSFYRGVPEPIANLLNLGPVCWQAQHDAPYWFSETAGEVSRRLNAIVDLGIIDDTLAGIGKTVHKARTRLEVAEENLTAAKQEHDALDWVADFNLQLAIVEAIETKYQHTAAQAETLHDVLEGIQTHRSTLEKATRADVCGKNMLDVWDKAWSLHIKANTLEYWIKTAKRCTKTIKKPVPDITPVKEARTKYEKANTKAMALEVHITAIKELETKLCQQEKDLEEAEAAVPKTCPTCGQYLQPTSTCNHDHP